MKETGEVEGGDLKKNRSELLARVDYFSVATLYEAAGKRGAMDPYIKPIASGMRVCGPAVTVQTVPGDNLTLHMALRLLSEGEVLLVSTGGSMTAGIWGEVMTVAAMLREAAGLVTDGAVRDTMEIASKGFPVFAKGVTVKASTKQHVGLINHPVLCAGVWVTPGDIVVGDEDGVVVLPRSEVETILSAAQRREEAEEEIMQGIRQGKSTVELLGFDEILDNKGSADSEPSGAAKGGETG
jgi:4-hydroxy-4-methyl-2-oxoglutarate aldolase